VGAALYRVLLPGVLDVPPELPLLRLLGSLGTVPVVEPPVPPVPPMPGPPPLLFELAAEPGVVDAPDAPVLPPAPLPLVPPWAASPLFELRPQAVSDSASATQTVIRMSFFIVGPL
jgi:hypothetical protein